MYSAPPSVVALYILHFIEKYRFIFGCELFFAMDIILFGASSAQRKRTNPPLRNTEKMTPNAVNHDAVETRELYLMRPFNSHTEERRSAEQDDGRRWWYRTSGRATNCKRNKTHLIGSSEAISLILSLIVNRRRRSTALIQARNQSDNLSNGRLPQRHQRYRPWSPLIQFNLHNFIDARHVCKSGWIGISDWWRIYSNASEKT